MTALKTGLWCLQFETSYKNRPHIDSRSCWKYYTLTTEEVFKTATFQLALAGRVPCCKIGLYSPRYWNSKIVTDFLNGYIISQEFGVDTLILKGSNKVIVFGRRLDYYRCGTPFNHG